jgi:hypothetical protein
MEDEGNDQFQTPREQYGAICEQMKRIERTLALLEKETRKNGDTIRQLLLKLSNSSSRSNSGGQDYAKASNLLLVGKYFTSDFIQQVVSYNIPDYAFRLSKKHTDGLGSPFPGAFIRIMMFAVKQVQKGLSSQCGTDIRKEEERTQNMNDVLRARIVKNLALNVAHHWGNGDSPKCSQGRTNAPVGLSDIGNEDQSSQNLSSGQLPPSQRTVPAVLSSQSDPRVSWMEPDFFKQNHFESGATVEDKSASSVAGQKKRKTREGADLMSDSNASQPVKVPSARKKRRSGEEAELTTDEVAFLVIKDVRERLTTFLNKSRDAGRRRFVEDLGFIVPDADELCNVRNEGVKVIEQVKDISEEQPEERDISLVPETHIYTNQPNSGQTCDATNDTLYGNVVDLGQRSGMQFTARYTVLVEDLPELEQSRELQRVIDLVEVSLNFCIAYFQSRDRYHFFCSSTHSLRLVYLVALCFRSLLNGDGDIHGTLLCLLPGKNVYTSIVEAGVTKMKLEKYNKLNTAEPDRSIEPEDELEHNALTEDEESGLMILPFYR